jgi:hypothetical protein
MKLFENRLIRKMLDGVYGLYFCVETSLDTARTSAYATSEGAAVFVGGVMRVSYEN